MKTVRIGWIETDLVLYGYEDDFEVSDDFEITEENCLKLAKNWRENPNMECDSHCTSYSDADQKIYPVKIDSFGEIYPPSPEEKRAEYQQMLIDLQKKEDAIKAEKEIIIKLITS